MTQPDKPTVSVVIPTFNRTTLLLEAVQSVLNQTLPPLEVIVVDDGSEQDVARFLREKISDDRVRCIRQENAGPARARNRGMTEAKGDYVAFLDSDDLWLPEKLAKQVQALQAASAATMAICHVEVVDASGEVKHRWDGYQRMSRMWQLLRTVLPSLVVKRSALKSGFDERFRYVEDREFFVRLGLDGGLVVVPETLVRVRRIDGSMMSSLPASLELLRIYERDVCNFYEIARRHPKINGNDAQALKRRTAISRHDIGEYFLRLGQRKDARRNLWWAWTAHPLRPETLALYVRALTGI
jgi:glycosyltransferase involved in cell wall biosynthesis